jgi:hypothetical protein
LSEAVESAKRPHTLHESKALNMGIAGLKPRQLTPIVEITGSGSSGSLAASLSSTTCKSHMIIASSPTHLIFVNIGGASDLLQIIGNLIRVAALSSWKTAAVDQRTHRDPSLFFQKTDICCST